MARFVGLSINKGKQGGGGTITKTDPFTRASGITTDSSNNVTAVTLGDNNYSNILYNNVGLITSYTESIGGVDKIWDLAYDSNNLVTDIVEYIPPPPPASNWPVNLASLNFAGKIPFYRYTSQYDGSSYGSASGLFLKPDGTAIYTMNSDNKVRRHNMSTPYDISTASQHSVSVSLTTFGSGSPSRGIFFKPDGTQLYYGDATFIRECNLSTPWDITTLSSTPNTFNFSSNIQSGGQMRAFTWKADGTKIYIIDTEINYPSHTHINEYNVQSAWDLGSNITLNQSNQTTLANPSQNHLGNITGISFKSDGTHMYLCSHSNTYAYDWTLNTAWDISSSSMNSNTGNTTYYQATTSFDGYGLNMQWKSDGTRFYVVGGGDEMIQEYQPTTPWDMGQGAAYGNGNDFKNGAGYVDSWHPYKLMGLNSIYAVNFCDDGNKIIATSGGTLYMKLLSTPYDMKTASNSGSSYKSVSGVGWGPQDINFNNDGTKLIVGPEYQNNNIMEFTLSTAFDITTSSTNPTYTLSLNQGSVAGGGHMSTNGMYIFYATGTTVYRWALGTAWDLSTANYSANRDFGSSSGNVKGLKFSDDGTQMILCRGATPGDFFESYTLGTAWALSTATKVGNSVYLYTELSMPELIHQVVWFIGGSKWHFMPYYGAIGFSLSYSN
mgnify:CR=1 FL=1